MILWQNSYSSLQLEIQYQTDIKVGVVLQRKTQTTPLKAVSKSHNNEGVTTVATILRDPILHSVTTEQDCRKVLALLQFISPFPPTLPSSS